MQATAQQDVAGGIGPREITGQRNAHRGADATAVERVGLNDDDQPAVSGFGASALIEVGPPRGAPVPLDGQRVP